MRIILMMLLMINITPIISSGLTHNPYSVTGHEEFTELEFVDDDCVLLKNQSEGMKEKNYRNIKRKLWGWSTNMQYKYEDATYSGDIVFSRSNKTMQAYTFEYSMSEVVYSEQSYSVEGSISVKESIKLKKVEIVGTESVEIKISGEASIKTTENEKMSITVYPNKKITLRVSGEAKISTCFAKYYVLGICIKKGAFECVDVITSYFELIEEDV